MMIPIIISVLVLLLIAGGGIAVWLVLRQRQAIKRKEPAKPTTRRATMVFRWSYIILPLLIRLLSIIMTVYFYQILPAEVAYHFESDGSPDKWLSRGATVLLALLPQLLLTLVAAVLTWGITKLSALFRQPANTLIRPERILLLMGNMIALPQIIFSFAMLDIFSYNAYQIHIMPLWTFALIIMGLGAIILGIFFIRIIGQMWRASR